MTMRAVEAKPTYMSTRRDTVNAGRRLNMSRLTAGSASAKKEKAQGRVSPVEQEVIRIDLCRRSCCSGLDGSPLALADWPCELDMGRPSEDLVVGVMSFDSVNADRDTSGDLRCSTYSSVSYYRSWIRKVMADEVPRSKCKMPPKDELPLPPPDLSVCKKACEVLSRHASVAIPSFSVFVHQPL